MNVYYHIVRTNSGNGGFNSALLSSTTNMLNTAFNPHNLYVNNLGFDYINSSKYYDIDDVRNTSTEFNQLVRINNKSNAINIYIINRAASYIGRADGILSQSLVIEKDYANTQVLSHEVGHCLNLLHTFQGTAINSGGCAEAINGSNCTVCGDLICDTPADANTGNSGGYRPDMSNIMSYYFPFINFSNGQAVRVRRAFSSPILQRIINNECSISQLLEEPSNYTIISPPTPFKDTYTIKQTSGNKIYSISLKPGDKLSSFTRFNESITINKGQVNVLVFDYFGNIVFRSTQSTVDLSSLPTGFYVIKAT